MYKVFGFNVLLTVQVKPRWRGKEGERENVLVQKLYTWDGTIRLIKRRRVSIHDHRYASCREKTSNPIT